MYIAPTLGGFEVQGEVGRLCGPGAQRPECVGLVPVLDLPFGLV